MFLAKWKNQKKNLNLFYEKQNKNDQHNLLEN